MGSLSLLVLGSQIDGRSRVKKDLLFEVYGFYFLSLTGEIWPKGKKKKTVVVLSAQSVRVQFNMYNSDWLPNKSRNIKLCIACEEFHSVRGGPYKYNLVFVIVNVANILISIHYQGTGEIVYILFVCSCVCVSSVKSYLLS